MKNWNCDGDKCRESGGEVRRLPTGGDSAVIVCIDCYLHEMEFRRERNRDLGEKERFTLPKWSDLELYKVAETIQPAEGLTWKLYECAVCGHLTRQSTNHFGETYSLGSLNACPKCPPYKRPTVWRCVEPRPEGAWVPENWRVGNLEIEIKKGK